MAKLDDPFGVASREPASPPLTPAAVAAPSPGFDLAADAPASAPRRASWAGWLALVLLAALVAYGSSVTHAFFLDDFWHLAKAQQTQGKDLWRPWEYSGKEDFKAYWFANTRVHDKREPGFFRPLVTVVYYTGLKLWGGRPAPFHAVNVAAHLISAAGIFWILRRLLRLDWAAALGAIIFAIHPCHYETVAWVAANADVMAGLFAILAIACFTEWTHRRPQPAGRIFYALSLLCFALSLASKEMVVTVPGVLLGVEAWRLRNEGGPWRDLPRRYFRGHLPFAFLLGIYLAWRIPAAIALMHLKAGSNYAVEPTNPAAIPAIVLNFTFYALQQLFLYPIFPLNFAEILGGHCFWLAAIAVAGLGLVAWRLPRLAGSAAGVAWLGLYWFAVTLLPFCFLAPGMRILHYPSAGLALLVGALAVGAAGRAAQRGKKPWRAVAVGGIYAAVCLAATLSYVSTMGFVSRQIMQIADDLDTHLTLAPAGAEVYLINLWQPAWMSERLVEVRHPQQGFDVQVLTFDPSILPASMRANPGFMARWFVYWFPREAKAAECNVLFPKPGVLHVGVPGNVLFRGVVEEAMPVAPEAMTLYKPVKAERFAAVPTDGKTGQIDGVSFVFPPRETGATPRARLFLKWDGSRWEELPAPPGWDAKP